MISLMFYSSLPLAAAPTQNNNGVILRRLVYASINLFHLRLSLRRFCCNSVTSNAYITAEYNTLMVLIAFNAFYFALLLS